jgi:hypothetical protein
MTVEGRMSDWLACGGNKKGGFYRDLAKELPNESPNESHDRQSADLQRCLIRRGYRYLFAEKICSLPNMKASPICGAP